MWSRLERWVGLVALAAWFFWPSVGSTANATESSPLPVDSYTHGTVYLNAQKHSAYRLLFDDSNDFADGKVAGILLLQTPNLQWQAFVSVRDSGCYALSPLNGSAGAVPTETMLRKIRPLEEKWLPDNFPDFAKIVGSNAATFGDLRRIDEPYPKGLPPQAKDQAALVKSVLIACDSPQQSDVDKIAALLVPGWAGNQEQATLESAQRQQSPETTVEAERAADHAEAAEEYHKRAETALAAIHAEVERLKAAIDAEETAKEAVEEAGAEAKKANEAADAAQSAADISAAAAEAANAEKAASTAKQAAERAQEAQASLVVRPSEDSGESAKLKQELTLAQSRIEAFEVTERTLQARLRQASQSATAAILPVQEDSVLTQLRDELKSKEARRQMLANASDAHWHDLQARVDELSDSGDRSALQDWIERTKPTIVAASPAIPEGATAGVDEAKRLRQQLDAANSQIQDIEDASTKNWQRFGRLVSNLRSPGDREALRKWLTGTKQQAINALGPVKVRPRTAQHGPDLAWTLHSIPAILLLLLLASLVSLWFLWQLKRSQDQIPLRIASDPTFKRTLQESVAPDQIRQDLELGFRPMLDAASAWVGQLLSKRSELFAAPLKLACDAMVELQEYQPLALPPAQQQTSGPADKLPPRGTARGNEHAPNQTGDEPKAINRLASESLKTIQDRAANLLAALKAADPSAAEPAVKQASRRESLGVEATRVVAGQAIALPMAEAFQAVTEKQAVLLQRSFEEMKERDRAINGLAASNSNLQNSLKEAHALSNRYRDFTVHRLVETGFLGSADQAPENHKLSDAMERFDTDIEHFPEHLDYALRLIALRNYLGEDRAQTLPYYRTAGLAELREKLEIRKGDWQSLFHVEEQKIAEALVGQWNGILRHLFRSRLLLCTYWPERTDPDLAFRLDRAHAAVEVVLHKHAIHPHPVQLLKPLAEVERPPRIIADDNRSLPRALADSREWKDALNALPYEDSTPVVVDVDYWGVNCKVSAPEENTRTLLIKRSVRGGTSSA
jgi:uncharacterized protein YidB (DUF937 family)